VHASCRYCIVAHVPKIEIWFYWLLLLTSRAGFNKRGRRERKFPEHARGTSQRQTEWRWTRGVRRQASNVKRRMAKSERTVERAEGTAGGWHIKLHETPWDREASDVESERDWSTLERDNNREGRKHGDGWNENSGTNGDHCTPGEYNILYDSMLCLNTKHSSE